MLHAYAVHIRAVFYKADSLVELYLQLSLFSILYFLSLSNLLLFKSVVAISSRNGELPLESGSMSPGPDNIMKKKYFIYISCSCNESVRDSVVNLS